MFHVEQKENEQILAETKDYLVTGERFKVLLSPYTKIAYTHPKPNVAEIDRYYASENYISHGNKKNTGIDQLYGMVQKIMLKQKERWLLQHTHQDKRYLDFGCGTGALVAHLQNNNWTAFGVEPSEKARHFSTIKEQLYPALEDLPVSGFNTIALWHVLEHLPDPAQALNDFYSKLSKTGHLFLAVPNFNSFDAKYYKDVWAAYDVPRHLWHFSAEGIIRLCEEQGFEFVESRGLRFDAYYVSYLSEKHKNSSAAFLKGICVGWWSNVKAIFTKEYSSKLYIFKKKA